MVTKKVRWGKIGVGRSVNLENELLILIQTQTDTFFEEECSICCQNRVVLTVKQAEELIKKIENAIKNK